MRQDADSFTSSIDRCTVLLECEKFTGYRTDGWKKFLAEKNITVICNVNFDTWLNKMRFVEPSTDMPTDTITDLENVGTRTQQSVGRNLFIHCTCYGVNTVILWVLGCTAR